MATQSDVDATQQIIDGIVDKATESEAAAMLGAVVMRLEISDHQTAAMLRDAISSYTRELVRIGLLEGVRLGKTAPKARKRGKWLSF